MGNKLCCMQKRVTDFDFGGGAGEILCDADEEVAVCEVAHLIAIDRRTRSYESAKLLPQRYAIKPTDLSQSHNIFLATHKGTDMLRQMEMVKKPASVESQQRLERHVNTLLNLKCDNIATVFEVFEDYKNIYMIKEFLSGGHCAQRILDRQYFAEQETTVLIKHMLLSVQNLHSEGLTHGNLSPNSFKFLNDTPQAPLKMDDFGLPLKINRWSAVEYNSQTPDTQTPYIPAFFETCKLIFVAPEYAPSLQSGPHRTKRGNPTFDKNRLNQSVKWRSRKTNSLILDGDILSTAIDSHLEWEEIRNEGLDMFDDEQAFSGAAFLHGQKASGCDIWSIGTIAFLFLCGYPPFFAPSRNAILGRIHKTDYSFDPPFWSKISEDAKDFVRGCLKTQSLERFSVEAALKHPWIDTLAASSPSGSMFTSFMLNLRRFYRTQMIETFAANAMAASFSPADLTAFLAMCKDMDTTGSGFLTEQELRKMLSTLGYEDISDAIQSQFQRTARDPGDSYLDYAALFDTVCLRQEALFEEHVWQAFTQSVEEDWGEPPLDTRAMIRAQDIEPIMKNIILQQVMAQAIGGDVALHTERAVEAVKAQMGDRSVDFFEFVAMMSAFLQEQSNAPRNA